MTNQYRCLSLSLCLTVPVISVVACDLPEKVVGETADPMQPDEPQPDEPQPDEPPPDEMPPDEMQPDEPPPPQEATVVAGIAGALAVDDTWLFIGNGEGIWWVLKAGGEPEAVNTGGDDGTSLIAIDDGYVYWTTYRNDQSAVFRAPKLGGTPSLVTDKLGPNRAEVYAIAVDDEFVYTTQPDTYNGEDVVVRRVPKAGGPALDLAQDYALSVAVSDSFVYWPRLLMGGKYDLVRADKDGANPVVIASELGLITKVLATGDRVFWSFYDAGQEITRSAGEGGETVTLLAASDLFIGTPAVTADTLYWLRGGGTEEGGVLRVALDENAAYWAYEGLQGGAPRVYRIAQ